jgi:hypothetical protein
VEVLKSIPRQLFTDDRHYTYYRTYVVPKLGLVGRSYIQRHPRWRRQVLRHSYFMRVTLSNSYVIVSIDRAVELLEEENGRYTVPRDRGVRTYSYLLGLNSDGRLFVNRVEPTSMTISDTTVKHLDYVTIRETEDPEIMRALGFDRSTDLYEEITIRDPGSYRVQGEVILAANQFWTGTAESIEDFYGRVVESVQRELLDYAHYLAIDRVMVELLSMGFSVRMTRDRGVERIRIVDSIDGRGGDDEKAAAVAVELCRRLSGLGTSKDPHSRMFRCDIEDGLLGSYTVAVDRGRVPYGERYGDIEVFVGRPVAPRIVEVLSREFMEWLRRLPRGSFRIMLGNHLVEVENAYSTSVAYTPSIQPLVLPHRVLTTEGVSYYVDQHSEVRITHQDHGTITIRFARPFMVGFTVTLISERYPGEVNRVLVRKLLSEHRDRVRVLVSGKEYRCVPLSYPEGREICVG